jgi:Ca-activated chloride channel family protein
MSGLHWLHPWWLLLGLLPLPLLLLQRGGEHPRLAQFIQRHLWARVLSAPLQGGKARRAGFVTAWLLLSLALAGPFLASETPAAISQEAANITVIMDISPSMGAQDVQPSRLGQAKKIISDFSQHMEGQRLALIAFSANAYTVLPLTQDTGAFRHFLNQLDPSLAYVAGSNLGRALRQARQVLDNKQQTGGLVLLVSDGEIHDAEAIKAAADLKQAGHTLITLGMGTVQGAPVPLAGGRLVRRDGIIFTSQLQRSTLRSLAQAGGGEYFDLQPEIWPELERRIGHLQQSLFENHIETHMEQPLFPLLILLALAILFWQQLRRPQGLAVLLAGLVVLAQPDPAAAAPWTEAKGLKQLENKDNQGALETYSQLDNYAGLMGKGAAAYRLGDAKQALQVFRQAFDHAGDDEARARAAYNQGIALVRLQQLEPAIRAFQQAVKLRGTYPRANLNLTLLNQAKQQWGAKQRRNKKDEARPGPGQARADSGSGGTAAGTPRAGDSQRDARLSRKQTNQGGEQQKHNAELDQSLSQWSQLPQQGPKPPLQAWQQYRNLKEENTTLLKRRFEIEDKKVFGRVVKEQPW